MILLLYTTGHTAPSGEELVRAGLVERALDLTDNEAESEFLTARLAESSGSQVDP